VSEWLDERLNRLQLSVERCAAGAKLFQKSADPVVELHFLRKESSICLKRAIALWWGLRWGRK
jgi:hypothetical protein